MLSLKNCNLTNDAVSSFLGHIIKYNDEEAGEVTQHRDLKYLDLTGNHLTDESKKSLLILNLFWIVLDEFAKLFDCYNLLEYLGLGNNNLSDLVRVVPNKISLTSF